ncbi:SagB/ThcOx family dehydrogenase [Kitasatospora sp. NPDC002040]|uniref:SagB/ThcOx family dehydrogenase n=1 Tax=Kitasatospora sp. NPDC002040 TaxID=3154661 RepID=UPI00332C5E26
MLRAVDPIFIQPTPTGILVSSPLVADRLRVAPQVAELLLAARNPLPENVADIGLGLTPKTYGTALRQLLRLGFLVEDGDGVEGVEDGGAVATPAPWDAWGDVAWWFHQRSRNVMYLSDPERIDEFKTELLGTRRPSAFPRTEPDRPVLLLPRVRAAMPATFQDVLEQRRTHRSFRDEPVPIEAFATLLHYCFAPLRFVDCGDLGVTQLRASASAGARHEAEACVAVFNVEDVAPGLYRYDPVRHGLTAIDGPADREQWEELTFRQGFFETGGFGVVTVAASERMSWKYRHARAYRSLLQNVGHVAQVFSMTATALGLGAAITGAFQDDALEELLALDAPTEFATFVMVCGRPLTRANGLPVSGRAPTVPWELQ